MILIIPWAFVTLFYSKNKPRIWCLFFKFWMQFLFSHAFIYFLKTLPLPAWKSQRVRFWILGRGDFCTRGFYLLQPIKRCCCKQSCLCFWSSARYNTHVQHLNSFLPITSCKTFSSTPTASFSLAKAEQIKTSPILLLHSKAIHPLTEHAG